MRLILRTGLAVLFAGLATGLFTFPAAAQSFFEMIFGPSSRPTITLPPSNFSSFRPRGLDDEPRSSGGNVRTLCVRLCDGYYWPVSNSTARHRVSRDADICASSCSSEARIFMAPAPGGDIGDAHDLTGRSYKALSTAFVYRKRQVSGCSCRPAPWSEVELGRHHGYAVAEGLVPAGSGPAAFVVAGIGNKELPPPEIIAGRPAVELLPPPPLAQAMAPPATEAPPPYVSADLDPVDAGTPIPVVIRAPRANGQPQGNRTQAARPPPPVMQQKKPKVAIQAPAWSQQPSKYAWPGDAPARYR